MNTVIVVFRKGNLKYSLVVRCGLVDRVGSLTPKTIVGRVFKEVGVELVRKGFIVTKIVL